MTKRLIVAAIAALALSACATTPQSKAPTEVNMDYVNAVERHAASAGVEVHWVNPPTRKRSSEDQG